MEIFFAAGLCAPLKRRGGFQIKNFRVAFGENWGDNKSLAEKQKAWRTLSFSNHEFKRMTRQAGLSL